MEPAMTGGSTCRETGVYVFPRFLPQWSPPLTSGNTRHSRRIDRYGGNAAMEPPGAGGSKSGLDQRVGQAAAAMEPAGDRQEHRTLMISAPE